MHRTREECEAAKVEYEKAEKSLIEARDEWQQREKETRQKGLDKAEAFLNKVKAECERAPVLAVRQMRLLSSVEVIIHSPIKILILSSEPRCMTRRNGINSSQRSLRTTFYRMS